MDHPIIALVGIFNKSLEPILFRNYLVEHLEAETNGKLKEAEVTLKDAPNEYEKIKKARAQEMENISM